MTVPQTPRRRPWGRPSLATNLALLAGLLVTAGLPPYPWTGLLVVVGLALLLGVMAGSPRPGRVAWCFGLAHQTSLLYWLFLLDPAKSIPTRALVPIQAVLTILYVAVFYLGFGWAWGRLRDRLGAGPALLLAPVFWSLMEFLRAGGEMGFPWCLSGSAVLDTPFFFLVRAGGELAVGAALAATAAGLVLIRRRTDADFGRYLVPGVAAAVIAWLLLTLGAVLRLEPPTDPARLRTTPLPVAVVQANVALADKWADAKLDSSRIPYAELTAAAAREGAQFVVWAETAIPAYVRYDEDLLEWTRGVVREAGVHLFAGFPDAERRPDGTLARFNASGLFGPSGLFVGRYAKHHLLPIGEAMPFTSVLPFLAKLDVGQAEWSPGAAPAALPVETDEGVLPFAALICFESAFARLARAAVRNGARCLAVITNDGWFGRSAGPRQHADLARIRAAECGVPVIRCANNGISLVTDARGRVQGRLGLGRRGLVRAQVAAGPADTAFVRWGHQPLFAVLLLWTGLVLVIAGRERRR